MTELAALHVMIDGDASGLKSAASSATGSLAGLGKGGAAAAKAVEREMEKSARAVDRLRQAIDPAYAATKRIESATQTLSLALKNGQISQAQYATSLQQVQQRYAAVERATVTHGNALAAMAGRTSNLRYVFREMGTQAQGLAMQFGGAAGATGSFAGQAAQMATAFGPLGFAVGTVATIALPLLGAAFGNATNAGKQLEAAMAAVKQIATDLDAANDLLALSTDELTKKYGFAAQRVREFALAQAELVAAQASRSLQDQIPILDGVIAKYAGLQQRSRGWADELARINRDFGLTGAAAKQFQGILSDLRQADTFEQQQIQLQRVLEYLEKNNIALSTIPTELQEALSQMIALSNETDRARALMASLAGAAAGVTIGVPLKSTDPNLLPPAASGSGRGFGGGGGGGNPILSELESLRSSLMMQEEAQIESFTRQQEVLQTALGQRLITQQEYNDMMQAAQAKHQEAMAGIDVWRYGDGLSKAAAYMGGMETLLSGGNERMLKVAKAFGAAQALISTYQGAAKELEKGTFGFASAAAVIAKGMAFISAIKGAGGSRGGGGGGSSSAASAPAQLPERSLYLNISGSGADSARIATRVLIEQLNQAAQDGYRLNPYLVGG